MFAMLFWTGIHTVTEKIWNIGATGEVPVHTGK